MQCGKLTKNEAVDTFKMCADVILGHHDTGYDGGSVHMKNVT